MAIFFSAARTSGGSAIARAITAGVPLRAANDNAQAGTEADVLLHSTLRHFAEHGMGAARTARDRAQAAWRDGDADACRTWLEICRALDRRMGVATAMRLGLAGFA